MNEDIAAPAILNRLPHVPFVFVVRLDLVKKHHRVAPRQLCSYLLHKFMVRANLGKGARIFKIARGKAVISGKAWGKSAPKRSTTFAPHPSSRCRSRISGLICQ